MNSIENKYTKNYGKEFEKKERSMRDNVFEATKRKKESSFLLPLTLAVFVSILFIVFMFRQQQRLAAKMR